MATPYFQLRTERVPSTQDVARDRLEELPVLVLAAAQTQGRGRSGTGWLTADRALAVSLGIRIEPGDDRPLSLMAGVAALRATGGTSLKWPNDVLRDEVKVGGILVEQSGQVAVIGLGLNLWWRSPSDGAGSLFEEDPGESLHLELGGVWGAELVEMIDSADWPIEDYRRACITLGRQISWQPDGKGRAVDIGDDGGLIVQTGSDRNTLHSGEIRHVREVEI